MGASVAPADDNVFMGRLEETTLASADIKPRDSLMAYSWSSFARKLNWPN